MLQSVTNLPQEEWDRFACAGCNSPFLRHDWLRCLEQSGCATEEKGWTPTHLVLRDVEDSNEILAITPAYVKMHSLGEFVFDQEWAEAAYGADIMYYPKLLVAVPFTPATGRRIMTGPDVSAEERLRLLRLMATVLVRVCKALPVSSVHVNFCREDEVMALSEVGFLPRKGLQYHFTNYKKGQDAIAQLEKQMSGVEEGSTLNFEMVSKDNRVPYVDFEDYLSEFKSKKRIKMRRERQVVRSESGLRIEVLRGEEISDEMMEQMFYIYKSTVDKMLFGRQYLSKDFFEMLGKCADFKQFVCLVLARAEDDGRIVGGTFNIIGGDDEEGTGGDVFYGRYWGCTEEFRYLHFEACYYAAIEYCIGNGIARMEPGAGGGDFKYMRGFEPCITMSMHYLGDERLSNAVARYLDLEGAHIEGAVEEMNARSAIRAKRGPT